MGLITAAYRGSGTSSPTTGSRFAPRPYVAAPQTGNFYERVGDRRTSMFERVNPVPFLDQVVGGGAGIAGRAVQEAGRIVEAPFSLLGGIALNLPGIGKPLADAGDFIGRTPVGAALGGLNDVVNTVSNVPAALLNRGDAELIRRYGDKPDDFVIPGDFLSPGFGEVVDDPDDWAPGFLGIFGIGRQKTMGELRAELASRGFTSQDFAAIRSGQASTFDFGDKMVNDSFAADLGARLVLDPFNLIFFGAGGIANAVRKAGGTGAAITQAYGRAYSTVMQTSRASASRALPAASNTERALTAFGQGDTSFNTLQEVGRYFSEVVGVRATGAMRTAVNLRTRAGATAAVKGTANFFLNPKGYASRTGYLKRAAAIYGVSNLGAIIPFEDPLSMRIKGFSEDVLNNQPFSNNAAFILGAAAFSPVVPTAREVVSDSQRLLRESGFYRSLDDELAVAFPGRRPSEVRAQIGEEQFFAHAAEIVIDKLRKETPIIAAFQSQFDAGNRSYTALAPMIQGLTRRALEEGKITGKMIVQRMRDTIESPQIPGMDGTPPFGFTWGDGKLYLDSLPEYRKAVSEIAETLHNKNDYTAGLRQKLSKEDLDLSLVHLDNLDFSMTVRELEEFLWPKRALFEMDPDNRLARFFLNQQRRGPDAEVPMAELRQMIQEFRDHPLTPYARDLYHADRQVALKGMLNTPVRPAMAVLDLREKMAALREADGTISAENQGAYDLLTVQFNETLARRVRSAARRSYAGKEEVQRAMYSEAQEMRRLGLDDLAERTTEAMNRIVEGVKPLRRDTAKLSAKAISRIKEYTTENSGATFNPYTNRFIEGKGFAVAVPKEGQTYALVDVGDDLAFAEAIAGVTKDYPGHMIGTWIDPDTGQFGIDPARVFDSERQARIYSARHGQQAYFDMEKGVSVKMADLGPDDIPKLSDDANDFVNYVDELDRKIEASGLPAPKLDERAGQPLPHIQEKLEGVETYLREIKSPYTPVKLPGIHYLPQPGDSLPTSMMKQRNTIARHLFTENYFGVDTGRVGRVANRTIRFGTFPLRALGFLFDRVEGNKMAADSRRAFYQDVLRNGGSIDDANSLLQAWQQHADDAMVFNPEYGWRGFTSISHLTRGTVNRLARTALPDANHPLRVGLKDDFAGLLDRSTSRTLRRLDNSMRQSPRGQLARLTRDVYNDYRSGFRGVPLVQSVTGVSRIVSNTAYHIFRFMLDIRWYAMNKYEQHILGITREGFNAGRGGHYVSPAGRRASEIADNGLGKTRIEDTVDQGWRHHNPNMIARIARIFDAKRPETTVKVLNEIWNTDPAILSFRRRFPDASPDDLAARIDKDWVSFDEVGVGKTVQQEWKEMFATGQMDPLDTIIMGPIIDRITQANKATFDGLVNLMAGNPNRRNIERVMNSYWLYWPISYQLKAARWLLRTMTERAFGTNTNLYGVWKYAQMKEYFHEVELMNPDAVDRFNDEAIWGVAQMMFPITPDDMGVSLNRVLRAAGGGLGVFDPMFDSRDPIAWITYGAEIGPVYTIELLKGLGEQFFPTPEVPEGTPLALQLQDTVAPPQPPAQLNGITLPTIQAPVTGSFTGVGQNPYETQTFEEGGEWLAPEEFNALMEAREEFDRAQGG